MNTYVLAVVIGLMAFIAVFSELRMGLNPDSSWLLYVAQRVMNGQQLYIDAMETNPPLIVWVSMAPVWLAAHLHMPVALVFLACVALLSLGSMLFVLHIARTGDMMPKALMLYLALAFFVNAVCMFGEREQLMLILVLPYLFHSLLRNAERAHYAERTALALLAGLGFALKPFFLVLWAANALWLAWDRKQLRALVMYENWVIGVVQCAYVLAVYLITPTYFTTMLPILADSYFAFGVPLSRWLPLVAGIAGAAIALLLLAKPRWHKRRLLLHISVWLLACVAMVVLQQKDWVNHLYPMTFMALLIVYCLFVDIVSRWRQSATLLEPQEFSVCIAAGVILLYVLQMNVGHLVSKPSESSFTRAITAKIDQYAEGKEVYGLSYALGDLFPAISASKGVFSGSFQHLWPMPGMMIRAQQGKETEKTRQFLMDTLVRDFTNHPPKLVWVDEQLGVEAIAGYPILPENKDIVGVLKRDKRFAKLWKQYKKLGEVEDNAGDAPRRFALYLRSN